MSAEPSAGGETFALSRWLFLRLLGVVYLVAFASLAVQVTGLIGEHGLLPAGRFLEAARTAYGATAYRVLPTVFWLGSSDLALRLVAWGGAALAALLIAGLAPLPILLALWALYLSLTVAGQSFLSFQWDALLLEAGLLAALWAPARWRPRRAERAPSSAVRLLLVFLLFKLMFLSGITKLLSGDPTWWSGTALDYHFMTQPLPTWTAWYAHHAPGSVHRAATLGMFAIEMVAPWFLFAPVRYRALRVAACAAVVLFQLAIAATGNYAFFNLLSIVLCIPVLDDAVLRRIVPLPVEAPAPESPARRKVIAVAVPVLLLLSAASLVREIAYTLLPAAPGVTAEAAAVAGLSNALLAPVEPLRSVNGYGLFRVMTTHRPELIIEGSRDGVHWAEYEFRYKPGPVNRRPSFVAPHHPRLDWQMWFAALDPVSNYDWLHALADHLRAGTPEVLDLLGANPFRGAPPRFIRVVSYEYRFSTPDERRRTGAWWVREAVGVARLSMVAPWPGGSGPTRLGAGAVRRQGRRGEV